MKLFTYFDGEEGHFVRAKTHEEAMKYFNDLLYGGSSRFYNWEVRMIDTEDVNAMYEQNENEIMRLQKENEKLEKYLW